MLVKNNYIVIMVLMLAFVRVSKAEEIKTVDAKVEETKVEEAKVEEAKVEEAKVEEAKVEEAKVEEARADKTGSLCPSLRTSNEVLSCVQKVHPDLLAERLNYQSKIHAISEASQVSNPELEFELFDKKGEGVTAEIGLYQNFQLGGKVSAREGVAIAEKEISELELLKQKEQIALNTVRYLYRLRQIKKELDIVDENISTFKRLLRRYPNPSRLSPEQRVSVSVFDLSLRENRLKRNSLQSEFNQIQSQFEWIFGEKRMLTDELLPPLKKEWPLIGTVKNQSTDMKIANRKLIAKERELDLERANGWPDLSFGPKVGAESAVEGKTEYIIGVQLSMPLPLFNTNSGGRAKATSLVSREAVRLKSKERKIEIFKERLLSQYKRITESLKQILNSVDLEKQHQRLHKLLNRGVISAPLVIESHRQLLEYFQSLHQQELEAIETLWTIYALEGRILNEKIN